jgi:hypothetical protein
MPAWKLREIGDDPSPIWFDSSTSSNPIMNILIWNCRGSMKPKFKSTWLDLVSWHRPTMVIVTETRMGGQKAEAIIRSLLFDSANSTDTIGFAGGIWLLWRSDMVDVDVLSATEQEIHALIRVSPSSPLGSLVLYMLVLGLLTGVYSGTISRLLRIVTAYLGLLWGISTM